VGEHATMMGLGVVFMCMYIAGIPLLMFFILYKNRKALHNENHPKHEEVLFEFGGLYSQVRAP
jgi:hypothetical protein